MTKVLILSLVFSPDNVSTAHIISGIASDLKSYGNDLCVITTTPHYHRDQNLENQQPLKNLFFGIIKKSQFEGIPVYHIKVSKKHIGKFCRIISWIYFHFLSSIIGICLKFKSDVILVPSPPLSIGLNAFVISKLTRSRYIYNIQELYPDIAVNLDVIGNKGIISILTAMEKFIYNQASAVTTITESIHEKVIGRVKDSKKVFLIPNFVSISDVQVASRINSFSTRYQIENKFVVTYAGNIGIPQNILFLVKAAKILEIESNINFLIVGDGSGKSEINNFLKKEAVTNVYMIDYQPFSVMPMIYASTDVFYVGQAFNAQSDGIPSKIYRIMANRKPILAATTSDSDLAREIKKSHGGVVVSSNLPSDLAQTILKMRANSSDLMIKGQKAHEYVMQTYDREKISRQYDALIQSIVRGKQTVVL